jgi:hypothetical protein
MIRTFVTGIRAWVTSQRNNVRWNMAFYRQIFNSEAAKKYRKMPLWDDHKAMEILCP